MNRRTRVGYLVLSLCMFAACSILIAITIVRNRDVVLKTVKGPISVPTLTRENAVGVEIVAGDYLIIRSGNPRKDNLGVMFVLNTLDGNWEELPLVQYDRYARIGSKQIYCDILSRSDGTTWKVRDATNSRFNETVINLPEGQWETKHSGYTVYTTEKVALLYGVDSQSVLLVNMTDYSYVRFSVPFIKDGYRCFVSDYAIACVSYKAYTESGEYTSARYPIVGTSVAWRPISSDEGDWSFFTLDAVADQSTVKHANENADVFLIGDTLVLSTRHDVGWRLQLCIESNFPRIARVNGKSWYARRGSEYLLCEYDSDTEIVKMYDKGEMVESRYLRSEDLPAFVYWPLDYYKPREIIVGLCEDEAIFVDITGSRSTACVVGRRYVFMNDLLESDRVYRTHVTIHNDTLVCTKYWTHPGSSEYVLTKLPLGSECIVFEWLLLP